MITAEMQRVLLLVALAATAYLLILAWNDDYIKGRAPSGASSAPVVTAAPVVDDSREVVDGAQRVPSDVPKDTMPSERHDTAEPSRAPATDTDERLVKVTTDTMEVWIDRLGGDIVRVQLPRYPVSIEKPNDPFLLLDRRADHVYIAQSGLIGRDGPDSKAVRPMYEATHAEFDFRSGGVLRLKTTDNGVEIDKTFKFTPGEYVVDVGYEIANRSDHSFEARQFAQLKRDSRDLSGASSFTLGPRPYLGAALTTNDERYHKLKFTTLDEAPYEA